MDWNKYFSYDRFLDIHVFNKDNYDFKADVILQTVYQQRFPINNNDYIAGKKIVLDLPTKEQWKKASYINIFAGRNNETANIDSLLEAYHKQTTSNAKYEHIIRILDNIKKYRDRKLKESVIARSDRGSRHNAYNDLELVIKKLLDSDLISAGSKANLPSVINRFCFGNKNIIIDTVNKNNNSAISKSKLVSAISQLVLKDISKFSLSDISSAITRSDLKDNPFANGYIPIFVDVSSIQAHLVTDQYKKILSWVSEPGRLGKIRFNLHGDGNGRLTMTDSKDHYIYLSGNNIASWLVSNGYLGVANLARPRINQRPTTTPNISSDKYYATIAVAACLTGRETTGYAKNFSAFATKQYALAHDSSLLVSIKNALEQFPLPPIKITGAHEIVSNTAQGLMRNFTFGYKEKGNPTCVSAGSKYRYIIEIPNSNLYKGAGYNSLQFDTKTWKTADYHSRSANADYRIFTDGTNKYRFNVHTFFIFEDTDYIYVTPPHGFRFIEDGGIIYLESPVIISGPYGNAKERIAHSDSKIEIVTKDNT